MNLQRGFALLECVAALAIAAICAGALVLAISGAVKTGAHASGPHRTAAMTYARQMLRVAQDAWKYGSPGAAPEGSDDIALPVAGPDASATTMPAHVVATVAQDGESDAEISITVSYTPDPGRGDPGSITLSGRAGMVAPLPGARVQGAGLIPQPR